MKQLLKKKKKMKNKILTPEEQFKRMVRIKTIRSFSIFFLLIVAAFGVYRWTIDQPKIDKAYGPLRKVLNVNSKIFARDYSNPSLTKEFSKNIATRRVRVNGKYGLNSELDSSQWRLKVVRFSSFAPLPSDTITISIDDIRKLPKTEVVFNFKCIEGWSQITWWGGVKFSDFAKIYSVGTRNNSVPEPKNNSDEIANYCGLITPDGEYYVGIDMPSMMHPQTILCYEMNGQQLPENQGAPLRLIIPVKYGIKHIKRIGTIFFSDTQPPDYWALKGYDYFSGL